MTEAIQETVEKKPIANKKEFTRVLAPEEVKELVSLSAKKQVGPRERYYNWLRDRDREMVRGKFIFHEVPGGQMSFTFMKWPGDQVERYDLVDGQIYSIPLAVAKHLNKECKYPVHTFKMDENNKAQQQVNNWVRRVSFQSLEFIDTEDLNPVGTGHKR